MEQLSVYDYFDKEQDPLYMVISKIRKRETVNIDEFEITLNLHGIYEITSSDIHESKGTLEGCYDFLKGVSYNA